MRTPGGRRLAELRLDDERVTREELRATPETLRLQAGGRGGCGRPELAASLRRVAELAIVPDDVVLKLYLPSGRAGRPRETSRLGTALRQDGSAAERDVRARGGRGLYPDVIDKAAVLCVRLV